MSMGVFALNPEKAYSSGNYSGRALHYLLPKIAFLRHGRSSKNLEMVHFEGICKKTHVEIFVDRGGRHISSLQRGDGEFSCIHIDTVDYSMYT